MNAPLVIALLGTLIAMPNASAQPLNRCLENGKTVFTDKACSGSPNGRSESPGAPAAQVVGSDYGTLYGEWRGQAQYQATYKSQPVPEAHAVVPITILIDPQGRVTGTSAGNGCKLLGVAAPGIAPTILTLDVTFRDCTYAPMNRRFGGRIALYQQQKYADFALQSLDFNRAANFDVKATMRR